MPALKLVLDPETLSALREAAAAHLRPADLHAEALLRESLGLPVPIPPKRTAQPPTEPYR
jgi:hypothetical protein